MSGLGLSLGLNRGSVLEPFDLLDLNPLLYFDARTSMLNASSGQAGFLESVATLTDLAGSAVTTESVVDRRPTAMPLIDDKGYLYTSGVTGNYAEFDEPILPLFADFELEVKFYRTQNSTRETLVAQYSGEGRVNLEVTAANALRLFVGSGSGNIDLSGGSIAVGVNTVKVKRFGVSPNNYAFQLFLNGTQVAASATSDSISLSNINTRLGDLNGVAGRNFRGAIMSVNVAFNDVSCDFTTGGQHGASSFVTSTGQTVTINKTGLDPSLLLRRPVLRFDGASTGGDRMRGTLSDYISTAHAFLKFAVNGDSFADTAPQTISFRRNSENSWNPTGASVFSGNGTTGTNARSHFGGASRLIQNGWWNDDNGTIVVEVSITNGTQFSKVNNANEVTDTQTLSTFGPNWIFIGHSTQPDSGEAPMDLEQIILFDRVVDESDANDLYNHIK